MSGPITRQPGTFTATILSGQTTSDAIAIGGAAMLGLIIPASFTGASITFTVCDTQGGTYQALYDESNTQVSVTVAAGRSYDLPAALISWPFVKIVSGSAEIAQRSLVVVQKT